MAGNACVQQAGWKDFSFLGNRAPGESCRHGVAVLESEGLYPGGPAGHSYAAAGLPVRIPGKALSEQVTAWLGAGAPRVWSALCLARVERNNPAVEIKGAVACPKSQSSVTLRGRSAPCARRILRCRATKSGLRFFRRRRINSRQCARWAASPSKGKRSISSRKKPAWPG